jgi:hypothetical protein
MKTASPLGQGGTSRGVLGLGPTTWCGLLTGSHPGAARPLSLRVTPRREGIFRGAYFLESGIAATVV